MKFQLYLDSRLSSGSNPADCVFWLNQGIVGATECSVISFNFQSVGGTPFAFAFHSSQLSPSNSRFVTSGTVAVSQPFWTYIFTGAGLDPFASALLYHKFPVSGLGFNILDINIRDPETGNQVTLMSDWVMLLEFTVP